MTQGTSPSPKRPRKRKRRKADRLYDRMSRWTPLAIQYSGVGALLYLIVSNSHNAPAYTASAGLALGVKVSRVLFEDDGEDE